MKQKNFNQSRTTRSLHFLPAVDALINTTTGKEFSREIGLNKLTEMARVVIESLRHELRENGGEVFF